MKISLDKAVLLLIPYLLALSIFYNNGYWSLFSLSIFNYYEVQDIVKDIAWPLFKFGGLLIAPLFLAILMYVSIYKNESQKSAEEIKTEQDEIKKAWKEMPFKKKVFNFGRFILILSLSSVVFLLVVSVVTIIFYPIEDDGAFVLKYLDSLSKYFNLRLLYFALFVLIASMTIAKRVQGVSGIDGMKTAVAILMLSLTALIAYHYGRIEAYKIISGTDFRYWIDKKGNGRKYLTKVNKNYLFLDDAQYINPNGNDYKLDTLNYNPQIVIISEDSLKSIELGYFGTSISSTGTRFNNAFTSRNGGKIY